MRIIPARLGADVVFAFDELTTLMNSAAPQEQALEDAARLWAIRCLAEHARLTDGAHRPYQGGCRHQGAQHQRTCAARRRSGPALVAYFVQLRIAAVKAIQAHKASKESSEFPFTRIRGFLRNGDDLYFSKWDSRTQVKTSIARGFAMSAGQRRRITVLRLGLLGR